ncbi:ATP-grasp domain-containing protein [Chitinophaga pinensis]|uniref:ATP-grasp domain-containing protein n=1 Tax=Chitinophaga pinensis TaxID=79329 RepID=UPI00019E3B6F|nr:ATP-grasp domain-containing protein [Chitinophaga pinensis]
MYNCSLDDTLIARLEPNWVKRGIRAIQIKDIQPTNFPAFIKPVIPKLFLAGIFHKPEDFNAVTQGLQDTEAILVADIIRDIQAEARGYISNGDIADIALYEGTADLVSGRLFLADFIAKYQAALPAVVVVDIAFSEQLGWFILEFNACWGAGLNNCEADKVIDCIIGATINN